jgi:tetratricopeptide (TPR) repeat protein
VTQFSPRRRCKWLRALSHRQAPARLHNQELDWSVSASGIALNTRAVVIQENRSRLGLARLPVARAAHGRLLAQAALLLLGGLASHVGWAQLSATSVSRIVDLVEVMDHDDQVDIAVQFNCSVRYITHQPASEGKELRVQLRPLGDCGVSLATQTMGEIPPLSGGANIIKNVRVDADVPGQLTLVFSFLKQERFVIAQSADLRGIRLRLIDRARGHGKITLNEPSGPVNSYAVNLESQPSGYSPEALQLAHDRLKVPIFVSQADVDGVTWFRLRAGPFTKRSDAEHVLNQALADYPRSWLAIGDDTATTQGGGEVLPAVEAMGADPALPAAELDNLVAQARAAMSARDYPKAIALLTKLQRQPEFPQRAAMQELLGLARERSGQLAHAKAEYEEYLRRYPNGEAAGRVTQRLATLRAASTAARTGTGGGGSVAPSWTIDGGFGQTYRYDSTNVDNTIAPGTPGAGTPNSQTVSTDSLYTDLDALARRRGARFDMLARLSVTYAKNFAGSSPTSINNSTTRTSIASFEISDSATNLFARLGRQVQNFDGALGTFDGLLAAWQVRPEIGLNVVAGFPVEQTNLGVQTGRKFWSVAIPYTPVGRHWDTSVFYTQWHNYGFVDREAIGAQARLLLPNASLTALLDYDTFYKSLNTAALLGTMQLPSHWNLSFDWEHRNAPVLTTHNALIGQPFSNLEELAQFYQSIGAPLDTIYQNARDNTAVSSAYSVTVSRPLGQRFQFAATVSGEEFGATNGVGTIVPAQGATGLQTAYQAQLYGSNIWKDGDFNVFSVLYSNSQTEKTYSGSVTERVPLGAAWRLGPRLSVVHQQLSSDGSNQLDLLPSALLDWQRGRNLVQIEGGYEIGKRDATLQTQNTRRYYLSLSYRLAF